MAGSGSDDSRRYCPECGDLVEGTVCPIHRVTTTRNAVTEDAALEAGDTIADRYEIVEQLGKGAMGTVYAAVQLSVGRQVALKVMGPKALQDGNESIKRFYREARNASRINHPNVVQIHDFGVDDDSQLPYIAMELVSGHTLGKHMRDRGPLPPSEAVSILIQVARALAAAHELEIIHRDLKPENIIVQRLPSGELHVTVLDFGIAKRIGGPGRAADDLTAAGMMVGTPRYMSPEQVKGDTLDGRSDLYALGCIMFEMLEGQPPFSAEDVTGLMYKHASTMPPPLSRVPSGPIGDATTELCRSLLAKRPDERPESAALVARRLEALQMASSGAVEIPDFAGLRTGDSGTYVRPTLERSETRAVSTSMTGRRRWWLAGVGGIAALGLIAAGLFLIPSAAETPDSDSARGPLVPTPLTGPDTILGCPIWEASGVEAPSGWLGAAGADVACRRAQWQLGGRRQRTRTPAELLGLDPVPEAGAPLDPYADPELRERSSETARELTDAWIEGRITFDESSTRFEASIVVRSSEGRVGGPFVAEGRAPFEAANAAVDAAVDAGAIPAAAQLDEDVGHWWFLDSRQAGLDLQEMYLREKSGLDLEAWCDRLDANSSLALLQYANQCPDLAALRARLPRIEDDPRLAGRDARSLTWRVLSQLQEWRELESPSPEEARVLLERLRARAQEEFGFETPLLVRWAEVRLMVVAQDPLFSAYARNLIEDWPRERVDLRYRYAQSSTNRPLANIAGRHAWNPSEADVTRLAPDEYRTKFLHRAFLLGGSQHNGRSDYGYWYGSALIRAGRLDAARAFASKLINGHPNQTRVSILLEAEVGLAEGEFARVAELLAGLENLRTYFPVARHLIMLKEIAPSLSEFAEKSFSEVCKPEDARDETDWYRGMLLLEIAAHMGGPLGRRCLASFDAMADSVRKAEFFSDCRLGVRRYLDGDVEAATRIWRRIRPPLWGCRMPLPAINGVDPNFAAIWDQDYLEDVTYGGAHPAQAREAGRAAVRGDVETARRNATRVIEAWRRADTAVPAVVEMQDLLRRLNASGSISD